MIKRMRRLLPVLCTAGMLSAGAFLVSGCDSGGSSDMATIKPSEKQQAELDRINKETAEAHRQDASKKKKY